MSLSQRLNLQSKILLIVMPLVLLPIVMLGWYSYNTLEGSTRTNLLGQMDASLDQVEFGIQGHLATLRSNIELFSGSQLLEKYILMQEEADRYALLQPSLMRLFASYQRAYPDYYELRILLDDGYEDTRSTVMPLPNKTEEEHDKSFFRELQAAGTRIHERYGYNEDIGEPALYVGRKLVLRDESFEPLNTPPALRGYLVITSALNHLQEQIDIQRIGDSGFLIFTDQGGEPYYWPQGVDAEGFGAVMRAQTRQEAITGAIMRVQFGGEEVYLLGRDIHRDLRVYALLPAAELHAASRFLGIIVALITLVAIIVVSVLVFVMINWILINPMRRLGKAAHEIGLGHFDAETNVSSKDEIGELARSFEEMSRNLKQSQEQISYLAYRDPLTGLPNRRMFQDYLQTELAYAHRHATSLALLFIDLDNFKQVNDSLGHQAGDKLLHALALRIAECIRKEDQVSRSLANASNDSPDNSFARLGGDEFLILMTDVNDPSDAAHVSQRLLDTLAVPFEIDGSRFFVGGSIGISMYPGDGDDVDTLIKHADIAMYHAKEKGRNNYQFYSDSMNAATMRKLVIENDLRTAIEQEQFVLYYQPKINLVTGDIDSVEALIRWNHPDKGQMQPGSFIPIAESSGLILPIGEWIIDEAARQAVEWRAQGIDLTVSINISIVQVNKQNLPDVIKNSLKKNSCDAECLEIELTETSIMDAYDHASSMLDEIKKLGVQVAMDDFGIGYSSFSFLRNLPIDVLKIDHSFVRDITTDHKDAEIISAILAMAHILNLSVVAEGVETEAQMAFLRTHRCDIAQGMLISPPLTGEELLQFVRAGDWCGIEQQGSATLNVTAGKQRAEPGIARNKAAR